MIYVRRIFTQDLREGKQIAFTTEPSNLFFDFNFKTHDTDRQISFEHENNVIKTRLYAASSESRIDGELKAYIRDKVHIEVGDIIVFKKNKSNSKYFFSVILKTSSDYEFYNNLLGNSNHEVVLGEDEEAYDTNEIISDFAKWLNSNSKNNYFDSDYDKTMKGLIAISEKYSESFGYDVFDIPSIEDDEEFKSTLLENIFKENTSFFEYSKQKSNHRPRAILGAFNYLKFIDEFYQQKKQIRLIQLTPQIDFTLNKFISDLETSNLYFRPRLVTRFVASLVTKPFVLLNGLSGSGKTKLAQAFVQWICQDDSQYRIIPVGADWTNREPLLGYPDGLNPEVYVTPDNGALQLILDAQENSELPYFMILDEMNLSHVERYFADFLSIMESDDSIKLYTGKNRKDSEGRDIPEIIDWPKNLFIIGTVNIDETTYMFSPKVLDRANVIEFRLSESELESFFKLTDTVDLKTLTGEGASMSSSFLELAKSELRINDKTVQDEILSFFKDLSNVGAEFGYRTANEVLQLINQLGVLDNNLSVEAKVDIAVMQKLLPKLHGSRSKLVKVLEALVKLCLVKSVGFELSKGEVDSTNIKYPLSYAKLISMYRNVIANGFTSYAEA